MVTVLGYYKKSGTHTQGSYQARRSLWGINFSVNTSSQYQNYGKIMDKQTVQVLLVAAVALLYKGHPHSMLTAVK